MQVLELVGPLTPLVLAPLGLMALGNRRVSLPLLIACALATAGSFALEYGVVAALLTAPWLVCTGLVVWRSMRPPRATLTAVFGAICLAGGSLSLTISRIGLGAEPLQMSDSRLLLVAIHCWYAGFGAASFADATGRALRGGSAVYRMGVAGILSGVPLLVAGTLTLPLLEQVGGVILVLAMLLLNGLALVASATSAQGHGGVRMAGRLLISTCAAATVVAMSATAFLVLRGLGATGEPQLPIPQLAHVHGLAAALGLPAGLLGWILLQGPGQRVR